MKYDIVIELDGIEKKELEMLQSKCIKVDAKDRRFEFVQHKESKEKKIGFKTED